MVNTQLPVLAGVYELGYLVVMMIMMMRRRVIGRMCYPGFLT